MKILFTFYIIVLLLNQYLIFSLSIESLHNLHRLRRSPNFQLSRVARTAHKNSKGESSVPDVLDDLFETDTKTPVDSEPLETSNSPPSNLETNEAESDAHDAQREGHGHDSGHPHYDEAEPVFWLYVQAQRRLLRASRDDLGRLLLDLFRAQL